MSPAPTRMATAAAAHSAAATGSVRLPVDAPGMNGRGGPFRALPHASPEGRCSRHEEDRLGAPRRAPHRLGRRHSLRTSRRWHQRDHGGLSPPPGPHQVLPGSPRRVGGLHGDRLRQVDRPAGGMPCNLGPGRAPPDQWPVRRQAGPRPRAGHHRGPGDVSVGDGIPARGAPGQSVHGPLRLQRDGPRPRVHPHPRRHRRPRRAGPPRCFSPDVSRRHAGGPGRPPALRGWAGHGQSAADRPRLPSSPSRTPRPGPRAGRAGAERGQESGHAGRGGALGAREEVIAAADLPGSPIIKSLPGKAVVPDDHPFTLGGLGLLGTRPSEEAMDDADTVFMIGTNFPYTRFLPPDRRAVQIELDPIRVGNRMPVEVPLVGDARVTLQALRPHLRRNEDRRFLERAQEAKKKWGEDMAALESPDREPIQPQYLMRVIDRIADDDAILTSDSGTIATWAARHFDIRGGRQFYLSGNMATMAPGLPSAIAAQVAHPGRQCIAFVGDGFAMLMAELHTAAWHELPIKVVICNNGLLGQILWEQMALGYPEYGVRFQSYMDFVPWAESCGVKGTRVEKVGDVEPAIKEALAHAGPALVDVRVNPDEPPM